MKSLAELQALRDKMNIGKRDGHNDGIRIVVGMGTCGISAGARPVLSAFTEEIAKRGVKNATATQTGCIGLCQYEPMVEVYVPGEEKVTYVNVKPDMVAKIVSDHIVNGNVVSEYTVGNLK